MRGGQGNKLPAALLGRLEAVRPFLERDASVQRSGGSTSGRWRLRYREDREGVRRHRSLPLGDRDTALAVKRLIAVWREERRLAEERAEAERLAEEAERQRKEERRQAVRRMVVALAGGGRVRRRKTLQRFDEAAASGPFGAFAFVMDRKWERPNHKGGRPSKAGLW